MSKIHFFNDPQAGSNGAPEGDLSHEVVTPPCVAYVCGSDGCTVDNSEIDDILNLPQFTA